MRSVQKRKRADILPERNLGFIVRPVETLPGQYLKNNGPAMKHSDWLISVTPFQLSAKKHYYIQGSPLPLT